MFIHKYNMRGHQYASVCESYRDPATKQPRRRTVRTLGRVIDFEKMLFRSATLGVFRYDREKDECVPVSSDEIPVIVDRRRSPEKLILHFGEAYIIDRIINRFNLHTCINAARCQRPEALYALICYYILMQDANSRAQSWYEGSFARLLYPKANLSSQMVSTLLSELGDEALQQRFFKEYLKYCLNLEPPATNVLIDSTGLPNSIHMPVTAVSNLNGKISNISNEVRIIYVVDQNSGMPVYFRYVAGNIVDLSTLTGTIEELKHAGLKVNHLILDAGDYSEQAFRALFEGGISFVTRAGSNLRQYKELMSEHADDIMQDKYVVFYNQRPVSVKKVSCQLCGFPVFAYVCRDLSGLAAEFTRVVERVPVSHPDDAGARSTLFSQLKEAGYFMILSSADISAADILTTYYTRQAAEQIFDIGKNYSNLEPARVHDEEQLRGHLLITFIATVIVRIFQKEAIKAKKNMQDMLADLRNQFCKLFNDGAVTICEPQKSANDCYKMLKLPCPIAIDAGQLRSPNMPSGT